MRHRSRLKMLSVGVIENSRHEFLIVLPRPDPVASRTWRLPCGMADPGESPEAAMRRVASDRCGITIDIEVGQPPLVETMDGETVEVRCFFCTIRGGDAVARGDAEIRWIARAHFREYAFDPLSSRIIDWILAG
jgi:ADP-ribose pyrophosphatase YjhB (NUDIX family)